MSAARTFSILVYPMTLLTFLVGPLILYLVFRKNEESRFHMRNALNFQLTIFIVYLVAFLMLLAPPVFGLTVAAAGLMYQFMFIVVASIKAAEGEEERIWGTITFLNPEA